MKVLITGAAGFIGTNMTKRLLEQGHTVVGLDNFYCSSKSNIDQFAASPRYSFVEHDVRFAYPETLESVDWVFNFACPASPVHYQKDHIYTLDTNIQGVKNAVTFAKRVNAKLLHTSTSEVYGDPLQHPQAESYWGNVNTQGTHACYKEGKRVAESYLINYYRQDQLPIKIVRIFNTYGPYMDPQDGRVVSNFIMQALKGDPITVHGDGSQTRSFQYIDDLLRGMLLLIESPSDFTGPVNIGNPIEFTIKELAEQVLQKIGGTSTLSFEPLRDDDPKVRKPDITLAQEKLKWHPEVQLSEGLDKTIAYFRGL